MPVEHFSNIDQNQKEKRQLFAPMMRGARGRCPACGEGSVFSSGLQIEDNCSQCHEELYHHRADDLPAYLNIFIVGHVIVALAMILMDSEVLGMWTVVIVSCLSALALSVLLMRPLKGMVVGAQWAMRMHGFGGHDD